MENWVADIIISELQFIPEGGVYDGFTSDWSKNQGDQRSQGHDQEDFAPHWI
jgi:hypothetical protein